MAWARAGVGGLLVGLLGGAEVQGAADRVYSGCCDASAAVVINADLFAAASDEDNRLRLYRREEGGPPVRSLDVTGFLGLGRREEADLEAAARVGDVIFWIGSHSRNKDGKARPGRRVFFATAIVGDGREASLRVEGRPFRGLLDALAAAPELAGLDLEGAASKPGEDPGGLNIEGLAAGPGGSLVIGFRNPVPGGMALWVPLLNPRDVVAGQPVRLGAPIHLDLGGLSMRDMAWTGDRYVLLAGPAEGGGRHRLFVWDGGAGVPQERVKAVPKGFQAEAMLLDGAGARWVDLLSDDGGDKVDGTRCEDLQDPGRRRFRALRVGL